MTADNFLIKGEYEIPEDILQFIRSLLGRNDPRTVKSCTCTRKVSSIAQDLVYAIHHGKIKTLKQVTFVMTLKSMKNSRKVVDLLNKYGQCIRSIIDVSAVHKSLDQLFCQSLLRFHALTG